MKTKQVIQLDENKYFVGITTADESPKEKDVYLIPANCIETDIIPEIPENHKAKWENNSWTFEEIVPEVEVREDPLPEPDTYDYKRFKEYPYYGDQLDDLFKQGLFSEEMAAKIQAVKDKYPKE